MYSVCAFLVVITHKRDVPDLGWLHMQGIKKFLIDMIYDSCNSTAW